MAETTFTIAESEAEREKVYRLRYEVYSTEHRYGFAADHERRLLRESYDDESILFVAKEGADTVGALRVASPISPSPRTTASCIA